VDSHDKSAATLPCHPIATDEILIRFTDCVVVDFYASCERSHTRQLLSCAELTRCDQKHDLLRELLPQRHVAILTKRDLHWKWGDSTSFQLPDIAELIGVLIDCDTYETVISFVVPPELST